MDPSFCDWYTAASVDVSDDMLKRRWAGVEEIAASGPNFDLVRIFFGRPPTDSKVPSQVRDTFFNLDATFKTTGNENEVKVLVGAVLAHQFKTMPITLRVALATICAACSGLAPDVAIPAVLERAKALLLSQSLDTRKNVVATLLPENLLAASTEKVKLQTDATACAQATGEALAQASQLVIALNSVTLSHNLLAEEANILWWLFGEYSSFLSLPYSQIDASQAVVLSAFELANLTSSPAGPSSADGILHRLLSRSTKTDDQIKLSEIVGSCKTSLRDELLKTATKSPVIDLCPMHFTLSQLQQLSDAETAIKVASTTFRLKVGERLPPVAWASQIYRERLLLRSHTA